MFLIARKKGVKTMLMGLAVVIVGGYLGIGVLLYLLQPRMVYWPIAEIRTEPNEVGLSFENIYFKNDNGIKLNAWYVPSTGASQTLFCRMAGRSLRRKLHWFSRGEPRARPGTTLMGSCASRKAAERTANYSDSVHRTR